MKTLKDFDKATELAFEVLKKQHRRGDIYMPDYIRFVANYYNYKRISKIVINSCHKYVADLLDKQKVGADRIGGLVLLNSGEPMKFFLIYRDFYRSYFYFK